LAKSTKRLEEYKREQAQESDKPTTTPRVQVATQPPVTQRSSSRGRFRLSPTRNKSDYKRPESKERSLHNSPVKRFRQESAKKLERSTRKPQAQPL
jgi:hypothetical protein